MSLDLRKGGQWVADRLKEPTSWLAIGAGLAAFGLPIEAGLSDHIVEIGVGVAALFGFVLKEKGSV